MNKLQQHICSLILRNIELEDKTPQSSSVGECSQCRQTKKQCYSLREQIERLKVEQYRQMKKYQDLEKDYQQKLKQKDSQVREMRSELNRVEKAYQSLAQSSPKRQPLFGERLQQENLKLQENNKLLNNRLTAMTDNLQILRIQNKELRQKVALKEYEIDQWSSNISQKFEETKSKMEIERPIELEQRMIEIRRVTSQFRKIRNHNQGKKKKKEQFEHSYNQLWEMMHRILTIVQY